jgi:hypothetical protein
LATTWSVSVSLYTTASAGRRHWGFNIKSAQAFFVPNLGCVEPLLRSMDHSVPFVPFDPFDPTVRFGSVVVFIVTFLIFFIDLAVAASRVGALGSK